jgi:hypothetical protein
MRTFFFMMLLLSACGRPDSYYACLHVCDTGLNACNGACSIASAGHECNAFCSSAGDSCASSCEQGMSFDPKSFVPSKALTCKAENAFCLGGDGSCCEGLVCDPERDACAKMVTEKPKPAPAPVCKTTGQTCNMAADCCTGLICEFGECF